MILPLKRLQQLSPTLLVFLLSFLLAGCGKTSATAPPTLNVFVASSTAPAMRAFADDFQQRTQITVQLSTGPSNALARQILQGAPANFFLAAHPKWAQAVSEQFPHAQTVPLLSNQLVLAIPANSIVAIHSLEDLRRPSVRRIALAGPNVPLGIYARQVLAHHDLLEELQSKFVVARDARSVLFYINRHEVDAGILYLSDAQSDPKVKMVLKFPEAQHDEIVYPLMKLSASPTKAEQEFWRQLQSPEAIRILTGHGFRVLKAPPN